MFIEANDIQKLILFEDKDLLIVQKPSGLPTQGTLDKKRENLFDLLRHSGRWKYVGLHHRLDAPTSGVVLFTLNQAVNKFISDAFQNKKIQKTYLAISHGTAKESHWKTENYLKAINMNGKKLMRAVQSGGDYAITEFQVLEKLTDATLIQAKPLTGRMHQIRIHLKNSQLPILGDALYFRADRKFPRLMLHASRLELIHPTNGQALSFDCPAPEDFNKTLEKLRTRPLA